MRLSLFVVAVALFAVVSLAAAPNSRRLDCPAARYTVHPDAGCDAVCLEMDGGTRESITDGSAMCPPELLGKPGRFDPSKNSP
jgi:hypothetical protein